MVLKVPKRKHKPKASPKRPPQPVLDCLRDTRLWHITDVIGAAIGRHFVLSPVLVPVDEDFLTTLNESMEGCRPQRRLEEGSAIDVSASFAMLLPNAATLPVIPSAVVCPVGSGVCVEIKPKWGFLPGGDAVLSEETAHLKRTVCRYCMLQQLKYNPFARGHEDTPASSDMSSRDAPPPPSSDMSSRAPPPPSSGVSTFCPLDLYSRDEDRMRHAVSALLEYPQNNLRVFLDGRLQFPSPSGCERLSSTEALDGVMSALGERSMDLLVTLVTNALLNTPVLDRIAMVQRRMDPLDVEGIVPIFHEVTERLGRPPTTGDLWDARYSWDDLLRGDVGDGADDGACSSLGALRRYLVSESAKDCSVMIALREVEEPLPALPQESNAVLLHEGGRWYLATIGVVDAVLKYAEAIPSRIQRDRDIVTHYAALLSEGRVSSQYQCVRRPAKLPG